VEPPPGGSIGYIYSGCNSVEEVVVLTGNKEETSTVMDIHNRNMERAVVEELL